MANDQSSTESSLAATEARRRLQVDVGARIREVRVGLGIGQAECARGAAIDTSSMFRIEQGSQNLTLETLARIAVSLGVGMDELVAGVVPNPKMVLARPRA